MWATAASGGSLLFAQYAPFAILKPKNRNAKQHTKIENMQ
jgi:hypothetical protein